MEVRAKAAVMAKPKKAPGTPLDGFGQRDQEARIGLRIL